MNHRMVLGRYADVRETAAFTLPGPDSVSRIVDAQTPMNAMEERKRKINAVVERVRRHFGRKSKARGNKYARVAYAYFQHRSWYETGLSKSSFFHALKKVKDFFEADKHWLELVNRCRRRGR